VIQWLRNLSLPARVLVYAAVATLAFVLAASVGAMGALMLRGDLSLPGGEEPRPAHKQADASRPQQEQTPTQQSDADERETTPQANEKETTAQEGEVASRQGEAEYVARVGDIQTRAVEAFLDSHDKLLRYDSLTSDDVAEMQADKSSLQGFTDQVDDLDPPQRYGGQYKVFRSAINELHEGAQLAYDLVAHPTTATKSKFDEYDRRVNEAADRLNQSNEILSRDYKTMGDQQEISPL
jgi:hypothetical protein